MSIDRITNTANKIDYANKILHIYMFDKGSIASTLHYLKKIHPNIIKTINTLIFHSEAANTYPKITSIFNPKSLSRNQVGVMGIKRVIIEPGFIALDNSAFSGCSSLEEVIIPDTVTYIDDLAFYGCKQLTTIDLPKNIQNMGSLVFGDSGLKEITLYVNCHDPYRLKLTGNATQKWYQLLRSCSDLKTIIIKATVFPTANEHKITLEDLGIVNDPLILNSMYFGRTSTAAGVLVRRAVFPTLVVAPKEAFDFEELHHEYPVARGIAIYENIKVFED